MIRLITPLNQSLNRERCLVHAASNLNTQKVNAEEARSTIEDLDYALEVATYAKSKVMENAATSVIAYVNTGPDVLGLLLKG